MLKKTIHFLRSLEKQSRTIDCPFQSVYDFTKEYIEKQKWKITSKTISENSITIITENPWFSFCRYFLLGDFQSIKWEIFKDNTVSTISIYPFYDCKHSQIYWSIKVGLNLIFFFIVISALSLKVDSIAISFVLMFLLFLFIKELVNIPTKIFNYFLEMENSFKKNFSVLSVATFPYFFVNITNSIIIYVFFVHVFEHFLTSLKTCPLIFYTAIATEIALLLAITMFISGMLVPHFFDALETLCYGIRINLVFFFFYILPLILNISYNIDLSSTRNHLMMYLVIFSIIGIDFCCLYTIDISYIKNFIQHRKRWLNLPLNKTMRNLAKSMILGVWLYLSFFVLAGIICSLLFFRSIFFWDVNSNIPKDIRLIMSFGCIPVLLLFIAYTYRQCHKILYIFQKHKEQVLPISLTDRIKLICEDLNIKMPLVVLDESSFAFTRVCTDIIFRPVLIVSKGFIENLDNDEITAILAHEMFHIKKHYISFAFFELISIITLVGKDFANIFLDSVAFEYAADEYAQNYIDRKMQKVSLLINSLRKIQLINASLSMYIKDPLSYKLSAVSFDGGFELTNKFKIILGIFWGDYDISYTHPYLEKRIESIMRKSTR